MAEAKIEVGTLTITARPAPGGIASLITVTDEGPCVPPPDHARVFDPFFTTKVTGAGASLGRAVCKHLVTTAGGAIEAGDGPGSRDVEFRVVIPQRIGLIGPHGLCRRRSRQVACGEVSCGRRLI